MAKRGHGNREQQRRGRIAIDINVRSRGKIPP